MPTPVCRGGSVSDEIDHRGRLTDDARRGSETLSHLPRSRVVKIARIATLHQPGVQHGEVIDAKTCSERVWEPVVEHEQIVDLAKRLATSDETRLEPLLGVRPQDVV